MALGRPPFQARSLEGYRQWIRELDPEYGADFDALPERMKKVIQGCLQRDPVARYSSARELAAALANAATQPETPPCPKCGAPLTPGIGICTECTLTVDRPAPAVRPWAGKPKSPPIRQGRSRLRQTGMILVIASILGYGAYALWVDWRPEWIAREAIQAATRPGIGIAERESILREAVARLKYTATRADLESRARRLSAAGTDWNRVVNLEKGTDGDYGDRIRAIKDFSESYPDVPESKEAVERLRVWEEESRAFAAAEGLEARAGAKICEKLAGWQDFHLRQTTGLRRAYAWDRIIHWGREVDDYSGYAALTVRSASGLPPSDTLMPGGGQADPYFILLQGGRVLYRSRTFTDNSSPIWDEKIRILIKPGVNLVFEIHDHDPIGHEILMHRVLTPLPVDGPFRMSSESIEASFEIRREK